MKHNKKRNIGIIYELILKAMGDCLVENKINNLKKITKIFEKRFAKGTELYKEFRLFNALAQTTASDTHIAVSIITEAKKAARNTDLDKLNKEKSILIRDLNHKIDDKKFYYRNITNYKELATIQLALNEWRKENNGDIKNLIDLEKKVCESLLTEKKKLIFEEEKNKLDASDSDKLILKIMTEKINKKYKSSLSNSEKEIIRNYALYENKIKGKDYLIGYLKEKKKEILNLLEEFEKNEKNKILIEKVYDVRDRIENLQINKINDTSIIKFLTLTKLISEIKQS